jgi:hypothetical protein
MDSSPVTDERPIRVVPLPVALYESNGILFELYNGGQPYRPMVIRWERLRPISVIGNEIVPSEAVPREH